ncbi:MAG: peptide deformylase [Denitrovibrio sp.]|nr:MAG: peptide deformylase [Denitrovibrio sp.]
MAEREVLIYPDPRLKEIARDVDLVDDYIKQVIQDLIDTMEMSGHSTGIAATQIGEPVRIVVADASKNKKCEDNHGRLVMINPEILKWEGMLQFREGCMSVPDFTGNVNRARKILIRYQDENLESKVIEAEGFEAVLLQHETDHLEGTLFIDRVISKRTDLFRRKKYK